MKKNSVKRNIEDILALTPMQEGMLYHWLKDPGSDHYFEQLSLDISGKIDPERFEKAWNFVIETNEMLRTAFRWEKVDNPVQIILREYSLQPEYYDLSRDEESQKKNRLEGIKFEDSCKKFDLRFVPFRVSLCKLEEDKHVMILSNHHILFDGWSNGIILSEFLTAYNEYGHSMIPMKAAKMKFKEYVKWIGSRDIKEQKAYWNNYLKGLTSSCELSIKNRGSKISPHEFENERAGNENIEPRQMSKYNVCFFEVSKIKLEEFCKKYNITSASLFYSAWGLLLQRYNNTGDVLFGTTVSGRSAKVNGIEEMVGLFINTLPLRVKSSGSTSLEQLLKNINQILQERGVFENTPLMEIKEYSEWHGEGELFDTLLTIENYPLDSRLNEIGPGLSMQSYSMKERTHYDLSVSIMMVDDISIDIHYNAESIEAGTIRELAGHFHRIICGIIENPCRRIAEFDMLSDEEKYRLLEQFNTAGPGYAQDKTVVHLFDEQVEKTPWNTALAGQTFFTYAQLNEKANQVACHLMEAGVGPGSIVGIMTDRSFEMIIGIFGILKAGGAYLPIDPDFPGERIHYMLKDSGARILLSSEIRNPGSSRDQTNPTIQNTNDSNKNQCFPCSVLNFEHFNFESCFTFRNSQFRISNFKSSDLSYVIYTSGSTGRPKGVIVEHSALTNLLFTLQEKYPFGPNDTYLLKTSFIFDVSLSEIFGWFMGGGRLAVLEKHGEKEPQAILNAIEHFNVTHINFVPAMFNVFLDCLPLENARQLPGLKCVFLAGEAVLPESVNRFNRLGTGVLLENLYGPTEATVYASLYSLKNWDGSGAVPIGKPLSNVRLYILGPYGNLQAVGIPGELCIAGAGLARGYLNQPGLTAEKFVTFVEPQITQRKNFNNKPAAVKLYKTGDLARWSADGNIEFLGRLDHQVKIRGFRIELGEIENQLLKLPEVNEAVVVVRENQVPDRYLCAYVVTVTRDVVWDGEVETGETGALKEQLARHLPGYMIPTYIVRVDEIPLTASGKVNRQALPVPQAEASELYTAPRNELEKRLAKIWAAVLSFDPSRPLPGIDDNFFGLSGHSLNVTNLVGRINKRLRVRIPFNQIFKSPTIRGLAEYISDTGMGDYQPLEAVEQREYYALSSRQNRLYVTYQLNPDSIAYNIPAVMSLEGPVDTHRLETVFQTLIRRHESFRTSFELKDDKPVQRIHREVAFETGIHTLPPPGGNPATGGLQELATAVKTFIRPFDLSRPPLLRVGVVAAPVFFPGHLVMMDIHHIISDGISETLVINEFIRLYEGEEPVPLKFQYKDYCRWQQLRSDSDVYKKQESFWLKQFEGKLPLLNMPIDFPRTGEQRLDGDHLQFRLGEGESDLLYEMAQAEGMTLFMVLLAIYNVLLAQVAHQEDIVVGVPHGGRNHPDLDNIVGFFINTLVLRNYPLQECTFREFLESIRTRTLEAFENQEYQFDDLVKNLLQEREAARNPLFDVMFTLDNFRDRSTPPNKHGIRRLNLEEIDYNISRFDLILHALEQEGGICFIFEYSTGLYKRETIEGFAEYFKNIAASVIRNPDQRISEIEIVSEEKKKMLMEKIKINEESKIVKEHAMKNKAKGQTVDLSADFNY